MLYWLLKAYARLAIRIYCRRIIINKPAILKQRGPLLLACNHPNSFLDGIILTTLFDHPVHSLARGDAFKNKWVSRFLYSIQLLPVYRTSEGVENLEHNYTTFASCLETFKENEIVLIFSEGRCENEWHLRPLKKGTARLSVSAWEQNIPLTVVPVALNYSSFKKFGKEVHVFFGQKIHGENVMQQETDGRRLLEFNDQLETQLSNMVYEIQPGDQQKRKRLFSIRRSAQFPLLILPALAGIIIHAPLFFPISLFTHWRFRKSGHFDSVQTSLLLLTYPFYWIGLSIIASFIKPWLALAVFVILPVLAWSAVQFKFQADI